MSSSGPKKKKKKLVVFFFLPNYLRNDNKVCFSALCFDRYKVGKWCHSLFSFYITCFMAAVSLARQEGEQLTLKQLPIAACNSDDLSRYLSLPIL